jgi:hypothetical protein
MTYVGVPDRSLHIADYMLDTVLRSSDDDVRRMIEVRRRRLTLSNPVLKALMASALEPIIL